MMKQRIWNYRRLRAACIAIAGIVLLVAGAAHYKRIVKYFNMARGARGWQNPGVPREYYVRMHMEAVLADPALKKGGPPIGGMDAFAARLDLLPDEKILLHGIILHRSSDGRTTAVDPWGHTLMYRYPVPGTDDVAELISSGPNGLIERGEGDDIRVTRKYRRE